MIIVESMCHPASKSCHIQLCRIITIILPSYLKVVSHTIVSHYHCIIVPSPIIRVIYPLVSSTVQDKDADSNNSGKVGTKSHSVQERIPRWLRDRQGARDKGSVPGREGDMSTQHTRERHLFRYGIHQI